MKAETVSERKKYLSCYESSIIQGLTQMPPDPTNVRSRISIHPQTKVQSTKYYYEWRNLIGFVQNARLETGKYKNTLTPYVDYILDIKSGDEEVVLRFPFDSAYGRSFSNTISYLAPYIEGKFEIEFLPYHMAREGAPGKFNSGLSFNALKADGSKVKILPYYRDRALNDEYYKKICTDNGIQSYTYQVLPEAIQDVDFSGKVTYNSKEAKTIQWNNAHYIFNSLIQKGVFKPQYSAQQVATQQTQQPVANQGNAPQQAPSQQAPQQFSQPVQQQHIPQQQQQYNPSAQQQFSPPVQQQQYTAPAQFQQPSVSAPVQNQAAAPAAGLPPATFDQGYVPNERVVNSFGAPPSNNTPLPGQSDFVPVKDEDLPF